MFCFPIPYAVEVEIKSLGFSDHRAVILTTDFATFKRGPSIYKMNTSILNNHGFVNSVKNEINRIKTLKNILNPSQLWECIKAQIRGLSMQHSKHINLNKNYEKYKLSKNLTALEDKISAGDVSEETEIQLIKTKTGFEAITLAETRGAQLRAGIKYAELGEKNNRFFFNLEKNRACTNTIFRIKDENGLELNSSNDILGYLKSYYENLYKNVEYNCTLPMHEVDRLFLNNSNITPIDTLEKEQTDLEMTSEEILHALKKSKNDSSPGLDGIPMEVYKFFWSDLKDCILDCFKFSFQSGNLALSQQEALICLIYKGSDAPREEVKSWRPIALLNADYKLLAKVLSLRIHAVINKIVDENQCAFIKGRGSAYMLREVYDITEREKRLKRSSVLLSLDYAKAFDTVSTKAILKAITAFGFGEYFTRWIEILLKNRRCSIRNSGFISSSFQMERGVRQGCPISPLLFILTLELLAANIRADVKIKGLRLPYSNRPIKIRIFADDITLFLQNLMDFREILSKIKLFTCFSGLVLNKKKSLALCFGDDRLEGNVVDGIKFVHKIKILGIFFSTSEDPLDMDENYNSKFSNLEKICSIWSRRNLSYIGKITIIKSLCISQFVHMIQSIGMAPKQILKLNRILYKFIWQRKYNSSKRATERIRRNILCNKKVDGGLGMINLECFQSSFYLGWVERLLNQEPADWKAIALCELSPVGGRLAFQGNVSSLNFKGLNRICNSFWRRALKTWLGNNKIYSNEHLTSESPLFNNSLITFKKSVLFFPQCIQKNITSVGDVIANRNIISFDHFKEKCNTPDSLLIYNCIFNALISKLNIYEEFRSHEVSDIVTPACTFNDEEVGKIGRRGFYHMINTSEENHAEMYWTRKLGYQFSKAFWLIAFNSTIETRLQMIHYKIITKLYPTAILLEKMNIRSSSLCQKCKVEDSIVHFFYQCQVVKKLWKQVNSNINIITGQKFTLTWEHAILGVLEIKGVSKRKIKVINLIILLAKLSISKSKYGSEINPHIIYENELNYRKLNDFSNM